MTDTLLVADYSSLEIGIQGDFCLRLFGDEQITEMYIAQNRGVDMHSNNAREVFGKWLGWTYEGKRVDSIPVEEFKGHPHGGVLRQMIKEVWYGLAYGKGAHGFSTLVGADGKMIGMETADRMVNALLDAVPGMRDWFRWVEKFVERHHGIYSLDGRWCDLSTEMESPDEWMHRRAFRRAYNFPMQATGAGIIGTAMVAVGGCGGLADLGYRTCLQVHDELVLRGPLKNAVPAGRLLRKHMTGATANGTPLLVPLQVSVECGPNYYEQKELEL